MLVFVVSQTILEPHLFHIFLSLNSSTRASSGVMVAHLMPTLYFCRYKQQAVPAAESHRTINLPKVEFQSAVL
jgi:hypothetical protein